MITNLDIRNHVIYLNKPVSSLPKVGEKTKEALARLGINTIRDLLLHLPSNVKSKIFFPNLKQIESGDNIILKGKPFCVIFVAILKQQS